MSREQKEKLPDQPSPVLLAVAGSDPSGGAGIQADLKTACSLGVYGAAAITCLTVQNTLGVEDVHCLDADLVARQVTAVLEDLPVSHIKTGMIGTDAIARRLGDILADFTGEVIIDPVLRASSGRDLFAGATLEPYLDHFLTAATIITPNRLELERLTATPCTDPNAVLTACRSLFGRCPRLRAIVVTGGHFNEDRLEVEDLLLVRQDGSDPPIKVCRRRHPRIRTRATHGTGCTFASALAACHLLTGDDEKAFDAAVRYMDTLLGGSPAMGSGNGPLFHHRFQ